MLDQVTRTKRMQMQESIDEFIGDFYVRFNILLSIKCPTGEERVMLPLREYELLVEDVISKDPNFPEDLVVKGILRNRSRKRDLVTYRQCAFKIAFDMGYGPSAIATHFHWDHATMIHAKRTIRDLLDARNKEIIKIHQGINDALEERLGIEGNVKSNTEPRTES